MSPLPSVCFGCVMYEVILIKVRKKNEKTHKRQKFTNSIFAKLQLFILIPNVSYTNTDFFLYRFILMMPKGICFHNLTLLRTYYFSTLHSNERQYIF